MKISLGPKPLIQPTPVWLVASYDANGDPNVMTVAWGGICCSEPPCVTVSLRKATYTFDCIMQHKAYTVNVPTQAQAPEADYCGIATGRTEDKFETTGFTAIRSEVVDAPYIAEAPLVLECKVIHTFEIGLHTQFIGQIMDVKAEEDMLGNDGFPDVKKVAPIVYIPSCSAYYGIGSLLGKAYDLGQDFSR
jgi:flavin reductase (DIM6/NTAB) family NADH-FMN oxidoreductase RutF